MGINSHYEISQNNLAPCGIICIFTQDRGNDSVCGYIFLCFFFFFHSEEDESTLWLTRWLFVGLLLWICWEHMAWELGVVRIRHSSLVLKPNQRYLLGHNYSGDGLGFRGPARSWYILHTCVFTQEHIYERTHRRWIHTVGRTAWAPQCVKGIFSLYKTGRFARNARYYYNN